jgi:hypothetical protein
MAKPTSHWVYWGLFIVVVAVAFVLVGVQIKQYATSLSEPQVAVKLQPHTNAELVLDPQAKIVRVGDVFSADIVLNTGSKPVDGVDVYALHYDPTILKVIDDDTVKKGVQIKAGTIMAINSYNLVDEKTGTIKFSQLAGGGKSYQGQGVLATVHFKALASGIDTLKFDFSPGSTVDSNAAYHGKDQLTQVVDAIYTVQK